MFEGEAGICGPLTAAGGTASGGLPGPAVGLISAMYRSERPFATAELAVIATRANSAALADSAAPSGASAPK